MYVGLFFLKGYSLLCLVALNKLFVKFNIKKMRVTIMRRVRKGFIIDLR